jgi:hypothetical protein
MVAWATLKRQRIAARRQWQRDEEKQYSARSGHLASERLLGRYPGTADHSAPEDGGISSASGGYPHKHPGPAKRDLLSVLLCECHEGQVPPGSRGADTQLTDEEGRGGGHMGQPSAAQGESHHLTAVSRWQSSRCARHAECLLKAASCNYRCSLWFTLQLASFQSLGVHPCWAVPTYPHYMHHVC